MEGKKKKKHPEKHRGSPICLKWLPSDSLGAAKRKNPGNEGIA